MKVLPISVIEIPHCLLNPRMHHTTFIPFYQLEWSKNIEISGPSPRKLRHVKPHNIPQRVCVGEIGEIPMILQLWGLKSPCEIPLESTIPIMLLKFPSATHPGIPWLRKITGGMVIFPKEIRELSHLTSSCYPYYLRYIIFNIRYRVICLYHIIFKCSFFVPFK